MTKIIPRAVALLAAVSPLAALAQNYDYEYTYDTTDAAAGTAGAALGIGMIILWIVAMVVGLAFFILWIIMLVDCIKRQWPQRSTWLAVLIIGFFLGFSWLAAILYYFMVKRKNLGTKPGAAPAAPKP